MLVPRICRKYFSKKMYSTVNMENLKRKKLEKLFESLKEKRKEGDYLKSHFYEEARLLINLAQILGCMPISFNKAGKLEFKIASKITVYSLLLLILITVASGVTLKLHIKSITTVDASFDDKIIFYAAVLFLGFYFLPLISFIEGKKIADYLTSWINFEEKYYKITKKKLDYKTKKLQYFAFFILVFYSILFVYIIYVLTRAQDEKYDLNITKLQYGFIIIVDFYFLCVLHSCSASWLFLTLGIRKTAKILLNDLQDVRLRNSSFDDLYELWLDLKNLTEDLGIVFSWTYLFYLSYMFLTMMAMSYSFFASLAGPGGEMRYGYLVFTLTTSLMFGLIADCAHQTTTQVRDEFKTVLLQLLSIERDPIIRREMKWFIQTMSLNSPDITLSGYVTLNRGFNVSMLGTLVTYIVVVLQFRSTSNEGSTPIPTKT